MNKILKHFMVCIGKFHYKEARGVGIEVVFSPIYNQEEIEAVYITITGDKMDIPEIYLSPSVKELIKREFQTLQNFQNLLIEHVRRLLK